MKTIKGNIDPRFEKLTAAMRDREGVLLPKTVAASKDKPLVVLAVRR